ncbi:GNAT family N-acetyltransferase [Streptomyces sp. CB00455]|uniref:GNAT family N-acetyltransferase n=1 Tax=Streptomyces sp. CB00455 TaxID=1703927 RepID=UPI0011611317|nr:GNAT family N-acetyltransferase [Streptomyces sp. CB00455]
MDYILITDPSRAERALDDIAPVYESVFVEPPIWRDRVTWRCSLRPTSVSTMPRASSSCSPARPAETWPGSRTDCHPRPAAAGETVSWMPPQRPNFTREDGRRTFVVKELAVLADRRGHGIGRDLHRCPLHGITADRATLTVRPEAPAAAWYERLGYTLVEHTQPWDGAPIYRTLQKTLRT